jgi:hypothetical protein
MAKQSEPGPWSGEEIRSLCVGSDSEQANDRCVGWITLQTGTRLSSEPEPNDPKRRVLGHDPTL